MTNVPQFGWNILRLIFNTPISLIAAKIVKKHGATNLFV